MEKIIHLKEIAEFDKRYRVQFINSLPGFKSANLIGTINEKGITNLAVFSSVIHLGSNPPLMGFITRPTSVSRHTYLNIQSKGQFTINHIHPGIFKKAHQTSARYNSEISEFEACDLTPYFTEQIAAPYVKESRIKLGLEFVEEHPIPANDTILVVGKVIEVILPEDIINQDGYLDLERAETAVISGLDSYHTTEKMARLSYAKPDRELEEL